MHINFNEKYLVLGCHRAVFEWEGFSLESFRNDVCVCIYIVGYLKITKDKASLKREPYKRGPRLLCTRVAFQLKREPVSSVFQLKRKPVSSSTQTTKWSPCSSQTHASQINNWVTHGRIRSREVWRTSLWAPSAPRPGGNTAKSLRRLALKSLLRLFWTL